MTEPRVLCKRCNGCGQLANTDEAEPWTAWLELPVGPAALAIGLGLVRPVPCYACNGTGVALEAAR